jgi:hypothetical protein
MAKKLSSRKIPSMVITVVGDGKANIESLCSNEIFTKAVFKEVVEGIRDAIKNKKSTAILFELEKSDNYLELDKKDWKQGLQICLDKFIEIEDYEKCADIKSLMDKIN